MIFDHLILTNVGPYAGRQVIELTPASRAKPVILITALNGAGKTTFFDALTIALYGRHARLSKQGNQGYDAYLIRLVNRDADPTEGASLELEWHYRRHGTTHTERLLRTWTVTNGRLREHCQILVRDSRGSFLADPVLSERWFEHVDELLPVALSHLFFFDGEQIAHLADLDKAGDVLRTGIHALLGIDVVDQLELDLGTYEKRQRLAATSPETQATRAEIEALEAAQRAAEDAAQRAAAAEAQAKNTRDLAHRALTKAQDALEASGGDRLVQRSELEHRLAEADRAIATSEGHLRTILAGDGPLLLVQRHLAEIATADVAEVEALRAAAVVDVLAQRDQEVLAVLTAQGTAAAAVASVSAQLEQDRQRRAVAANGTPIRFNLDAASRSEIHALLHGGLDRTRNDLGASLASVATAKADHERLTRELDCANPRIHRWIPKLVTSPSIGRYWQAVGHASLRWYWRTSKSNLSASRPMWTGDSTCWSVIPGDTCLPNKCTRKRLSMARDRTAPPLSFAALSTRIRGLTLFTISMPISEACERLRFDEPEVVPEAWRPSRIHDRKRVDVLSKALVSGDLPISGLLICIDARIRFIPTASGQPIGRIELPASSVWIVADGQHRLQALRKLDGRTSARGTIPVHVLADPGMRKCQPLFLAIHQRSQGGATEHLNGINERLATECPVFIGFVDWKRSALAPRSAMLFTLSALRSANRELLRHLPAGSDGYAMAEAFWSAVDHLIPAWDEVRTGKRTAGTLRADSISSHGVVLQAMGRIGGELLAKGRTQWTKILTPWGEIDWSRQDPRWNGAATINGRVWKSASAVKGTADILHAALGNLVTTPI